MKQFEKTIKTTINDLTKNEKTEEVKKLLVTVKTWDELTREEKEEQIEKNQENIYSWYQDAMYYQYKDELENIRNDFPDITFDDIYMESNSQGWWIDDIRDFKYHEEGIEVFGENVFIDDIDFKIRRTIDSFEVCVDDYYIDSETLEKIENTKKYQAWIEKTKKRIQAWIDRVNEACECLGRAEWNTPNNLDNEEDREFLDSYFEDEEFEKVEVID